MTVSVAQKYTSQRCPICEHTAKKNRDKINHCFCCQKCGYRSNDDRIAAINLHQLGKDWLAGRFSKSAVAAGHGPTARGAVSHSMM